MGKFIFKYKRVGKGGASKLFSYSVLLLSFFILIGCGGGSDSGGGASTTSDDDTSDDDTETTVTTLASTVISELSAPTYLLLAAQDKPGFRPEAPAKHSLIPLPVPRLL